LILAFLLLPTFCAFPVLAFIGGGLVRWLAWGLWLLVSVVLGWVIVRMVHVLRSLNDR
jgi:hypothetical protein